MINYIRIALFLVMTVFATNANAQVGNLQPGQVWGNSAATAKPATGVSVGAIIDQGLSCSARGSIIFRGASGWQCLAPGTSGLALSSQGAGADLHYATLGNSALTNPSTTVNGVTCTLGSTCTISASAGTITIGTTTIASGTNLNVLYNNAGVLGQYGVTGTGTTSVLSASPTFTGTPVLATPTATSLALGGATVGSNALAVTGTSQFNGNINLNSVSLIGTYTLGGTPSIAGSAINSGTVSGSFLSNINLAASGNGGVTGVLPLANGGTGSATAAPARVNLIVDQATSTGDANYAIQTTDRMVYHTALTAARTDTLPAANSVNAGQVFVINDFRGVVTASNTITLLHSGSDTINGVSSVVALNAQYGAGIFWSDGISRWTFFPASTGGGSGTVTNVTIAAGSGAAVSSTCTISVSGTCTVTGRVPYPQGRITLAANTPVMGSNSCSGSPCTNQTTLRYDCYTGGGVPYFDGTNDKIDSISSCEVTDAMVSAASAGQVVSSQVYDVWWVHGGANRICLAMSTSTGGGGGWASDTGGSNTARGTGYSQLDRTTRSYITNKNSIANCFNGATNYGSVSANQATYLGTVYANANGQVSYTFGVIGSAGSGASAGLMGIWNMYNRVVVSNSLGDNASTWTYAVVNTWRQVHGSAGMQVQYVAGLNDDSISATYYGIANDGSATSCNVGIGVDSTTTNTGGVGFNSTAIYAQVVGTFRGMPGVGLHTLAAIEYSGVTSGTCTFGGTVGVGAQSTLNVDFRM